ncbi:MAG: hypothetical protein FWD40_07050 [Treponema sp.]|nr:hypothetical protein [Treponema sp.]
MYKVVRMCPDPQILSIYVDGELPSPWKEKMEAHFKICPLCREKYENFSRLHKLFKKDYSEKRTYVERVIDEPFLPEERTYTEEEMQETKERIWHRIEEKRRLRTHGWRRRLSIPLPAAAAAAVILMLVAGLWIRSEAFLHSGVMARNTANTEKLDIIAAEEEIPGIIPAADISGILQYLTSDGTDIIILKLPESKNFARAGEPAIIRAADYQRNAEQPRRYP